MERLICGREMFDLGRGLKQGSCAGKSQGLSGETESHVRIPSFWLE